MKNQTIFFIAVCIICVLFYRCTNPAYNASGNNDSVFSGTNMYGGFASQREWGHPSQMPAPAISASELAKGIAATNDLTAWIGPWGNSYAANITPDSTGLAIGRKNNL